MIRLRDFDDMQGVGLDYPTRDVLLENYSRPPSPVFDVSIFQYTVS